MTSQTNVIAVDKSTGDDKKVVEIVIWQKTS